MEVSTAIFCEMLVQICYLTDTRFRILTRDEPLGQREELLRYAAVPGERVTVGVRNETQTVIVEAGAEALINFNNFFRQASQILSTGDPPEPLTTTIRVLPLDESGDPLPGEERELSPSQGRISVSVDSVLDQFYVRVEDAAVPDSGVYSIEVCSGEMCLSANATFFVLDGKI